MRAKSESRLSHWWRNLQGGAPEVPAPQPYHVFDSSDFEAYQAQVALNYARYANGFDYYCELVDFVAVQRSLQVLPMYEFAVAADVERPLLALRHDIDADPVAALRQARHLARIGLGTTFYLLHSAPYYAEVFDGLFVRRPLLREWIRGLIVAGCEIGLHNDALAVALAYDLDPAEVLAAELAFLRAQGAVVRGTAAHNSIVVNGAENYEMFAGHVLWPRALGGDGRDLLGAHPLHEFGLDYEGTCARPRDDVVEAEACAFAADRSAADIRDPGWMRRYLLENPCCKWTVDYQIWLLGRDQWVIGGHFDDTPVFEWSCGLDEVKRFLTTLPPRSRTLMVLHPEYFGDYHVGG